MKRLARDLLAALASPTSPASSTRPARPTPADPALYRAVQAEARARFAVYPSAYANAWVVRRYKARGGTYRGPREGALTRWFAEEWVDLSRPLGEGYAPCGRARATGPRRYPKCVPAARAAELDAAEIRSAVRRKRAAELDAPAGPRAPIRVRTARR